VGLKVGLKVELKAALKAGPSGPRRRRAGPASVLVGEGEPVAWVMADRA
jgi:hypothetical protein